MPFHGWSAVVGGTSGLLCVRAGDGSLPRQPCCGFSSRGGWQHAVSAAEKLVGYPTSYLTLRSLLSDEMSNVATHLRKLITTTHPLVETVKQLVLEGPQSAVQTRGLLVLLVSKAAGQAGDAADNTLQHDTVAGLMHSQRSLAEITEMIHTAELIHKGVINIHTPTTPSPGLADPPPSSSSSPACPTEANPDHLLGNKLAILYFTESEFLGERDDLGRPLLPPDADLAYWHSKTFLAVGSLLAKACKSTLLLAGHTDAASLDLVYALGRHTALAWQGSLELAPFRRSSHDLRDEQRTRHCEHRLDNADIAGEFSEKVAAKKLFFEGNPSEAVTSHIDVTSLPVIAHLQRLRDVDNAGAVAFTVALQQCRDRGGDVDQLVVREVLAAGVGVQVAQQVVQEHCQEALQLLQMLPPSEARTALQDIIVALQSEQH
ncbi:Isoprenoid synthase domain [Trinorchestia longiramus]|nr:Isoprenoid synthase domain [Trinorchestia longiramus]